MEGYIYLGEHYDVLNREIGISDKKIGLSINPIGREQSLTKTKSPIRYRIVAVYKVDDMRRVEKMLHSILDSRRVFGEWFKDDDDTLEGDFINFMNAYGGEIYNIQEIKDVVLSQLIDNWSITYHDFLKDFSADENLKIPTLSEKTTSSPQNFLTFWEKRFNKAGEDSIRKISRLYSLL